MAKRLVIDPVSFIRELEKPDPEGQRQAFKQAVKTGQDQQIHTAKDPNEKADQHRGKLDLRAILRKLGV